MTDSPAASREHGASQLVQRGLGIYRQARWRTTLAAAVVLGSPFCVFLLLLKEHLLEFSTRLSFPLSYQLLFCVLLGIVLALGFGRFVSNHILRLADELEKSLREVAQREQERDQAQAELIKRLVEERELVKERLQFESQLAEYEKFAALAQLALGAAHEINNPLLGILSHLELELKDETEAEERMEIEQCIEGTRRISSTIRGLIDYARPGPLQLTKINIDRLTGEMFNFLCHQPLFRNIKLERKIPVDLPPITADANQISQVLMNLLLNAGQAMPGGGAITVTADKVKFAEKVEIKVQDTGEGIPADILPHVFEPFFTTKRGKGTGLGLSISQTYVHRHQGEITAESIPNRGTTVRIVLPIRQEGRMAEQAEEVLT
jgi:signal transduction histidine kinase